jgi:multidrug efflux pump subunit AcrA (membrane-fusion protein)
MKKHLILMICLVAVSLMLSACSGGTLFSAAPTQTAVPVVSETGALNVEGKVVPKTFTTLAFAASGEVETIAVEEGASVEQGALLMALGKREPLEAALSSARLEELAAQQALDQLDRTAGVSKTQAEEALVQAQKALVDARKAVADLDTDEYRNTLDDKETALQNAKDDLKDANDELEKRKDLDADNQVRKTAETAVEDAQKALDTAVRERDLWKNQKDLSDASLAKAEAALVEAQNEVDLRANGPDADALALAQARLDNAKSAVKAAERSLANMDLTAPFGGTIADLNGLAVGQWITSGRTAVTLGDFSEWFVETKDLNELDVVDVSVGQKVVVTPDALPDVQLQGVVTAIKPISNERSGDVLYTVRIRLSNPDEGLRWGMTVQVAFE